MGFIRNEVKKRTLLGEIKLSCSASTPTPIEDLEGAVKTLKDFGANHFEIEVEKDWEGDIESITFLAINLQYETDEEVAIREEEERVFEENRNKKAEQAKREYDLKLLKELKEKYE